MAHRGPDGGGSLRYDGGAAGMVRLALVDLSERGQQPMWSPDRRVAIIFNGEIYNFRTERARLSASGWSFRSTTDTEVILALYLERGLDLTQQLRGMYALAIFDWREAPAGGAPRLALARDPLGIKPLYIAAAGAGDAGLVFASEIRGLLASGLVEREIDREGLAEYLAHGFLVQPRTLLAGVRMLEPGMLEVYRPAGHPARRKFWQIPVFQPRRESLDEAAERLRGVVEESVAIHAFADAPVGAFLSGGIDSTGIVALMRRHIPRLRTFSLSFPDVPGADEAEEAAEVARHFGCEHSAVPFTGEDVARLLPAFARDIDQPSVDGLNTWLISRGVAQEVKGVLSGLGGDEWFAGYPVTRRMARYGATVAGRSWAAAGALAHLASPLLPQGRLRERMESLAMRRSPLATWWQSHSVFPAPLARGLVGLAGAPANEGELFDRVLEQDGADWAEESPLGLSCLLDVRVYMGSQLLRDSDVTSMAHSLELRVPFVDVEVAHFSRTCLDEHKLRLDGGSGSAYRLTGAKQVLIRALRDLLPPTIADRPKRGFTLPFAHWMQANLGDMLRDTCSTETTSRRGLLDPALVRGLWRDVARGRPGALYPCLWSLMILELWCRTALGSRSSTARGGLG